MQDISAGYGVKNMQIVRLIMQETGSFNNQFKRPYETGLDGNSFNAIMQNVQDANKITPAALTGVASRFIHPQATPESGILIPQGWQERRIRFFMEVQTESQMGMFQTEYIIGYTDHIGIMNGTIDPNMRFYINATNTVRSTPIATPSGNQILQSVLDSSHVLTNDQYTGLHTPTPMFRMRPEDIFHQMESGFLGAETNGDFTDTRLTLNADAIKSKRTNGIASQYVGSLLNSYLQTSRASDITTTAPEIFENARYTVRSQFISNDPFINYIKNRNDQAGNVFTINDLVALDRNVLNTIKIIPMSHAIRATLHQAGTTAEWGGSTGETVFATSIAQALPGYMIEHGINKFSFTSTNRVIGGGLKTDVFDVKSFMTGVDLTPYWRSLVFKLETELFPDLTYNGQMDYMIEAKCDLLGEMWLTFSIFNGPIVSYVCPCFCDALMSPVTTSNFNNLSHIAKDFDTLFSNITDQSNGFATGEANPFGHI